MTLVASTGVQCELTHEVPLIVAGTTEDKPEIANRVAWSGTGINLKTKTPAPGQIRQAVRELLEELAQTSRQVLRPVPARADARTLTSPGVHYPFG